MARDIRDGTFLFLKPWPRFDPKTHSEGGLFISSCAPLVSSHMHQIPFYPCSFAKYLPVKEKKGA